MKINEAGENRVGAMIDQLKFEGYLAQIPPSEALRLPMPSALRTQLSGTKRQRIPLIVTMIVPYLLVVGFALYLEAPTRVFILILVAFFYWFFVGMRLVTAVMLRIQNTAVQSMPSQSAPAEIIIDATGYRRENEYYSQHLRWSMYSGTAEGACGFYVWMGPGRAAYVPDDVLPNWISRKEMRMIIDGWASVGE